ncbi:MAG: xylan 1,4-beta-xylosidase, partial [Clostridiales bacterium]|nr:xylan 1,4-beta-xylosidase [Clostridiales bacterium]
TTNPLKLWHDIGEPAAPSKDQIALLKQADSPAVSSKILTAEGGEVNLDFSIRGYGVEYFTLTPCKMTSDEGYDYSKVARGSN